MSKRPADQQPPTFKQQRGNPVPNSEWSAVYSYLRANYRHRPTTITSRQVLQGAPGRCNPPALTAHIPLDEWQFICEMRRDWHREPGSNNTTRSRGK